MFAAAEQMCIQLIPYIPGIIGIYLVFDYVGMLFNRR